MEGEHEKLSPGLHDFLIKFKEELQKSRNMDWDELCQIAKAQIAQRDPGEDVYLIKDIICYFEDKSVPVRIYQPEGDYLQILVYFHGGGWVLGDLDTQDPLCRKIANRANCVVVSVDYSLAPEKPYPAALEDGMVVIQWIIRNARKMGWDPSKTVLAGDSAGGNIATILANKVVREELTIGLIHQVLIYPVTNIVSFDTLSYNRFAEGYYLEKSMMKRFADAYIGEKGSRFQASPFHIPFIKQSPSATIITAGYDPLRDEGRDYADRLKQSYLKVNHVNYRSEEHTSELQSH